MIRLLCISLTQFSPSTKSRLRATCTSTRPPKHQHIRYGYASRSFAPPKMSAPAVSSLTFSPPGTHVVWLSTDSTLRLWDTHAVHSHQLPPSRLLAAGPTLLALAADARPLVRFFSLASNSLLPYSARTQAVGTILALTAPSDSKPYPEGGFVVADGKTVTVVTYAGEQRVVLHANGIAFCAALDTQLARVVVGDTSGGLHLWNLGSGGRASSMSAPHAHRSFVSSVAFHPMHARVVSCGWDGRACVWEEKHRRLREVASVRVERREEGGKLHSVAVPAGEDDEFVFATGGGGGAVKVWRMGKKLEAVAVHVGSGAGGVYALAFSRDGRHVAGGTGGGAVRLFGVPTRPVLISGEEEQGDMEGMYEVRAMDVIVKGQRADRQLIFCPSTVVSLTCPICSCAYDSGARLPICSGVCGHTFACRGCNERMWETDRHPKCPLCRKELVDVAPNYELLKVLAAANPIASKEAAAGLGAGMALSPSAGTETDQDYVDLGRLSWMELPELAYMTRHNCVIYSGQMDGEMVAVRLPRQKTGKTYEGGSSQETETKRHLSCLKRMRGPHIVQLYGVSRTAAPDSRVVVVSELPSGGTLANNLSLLRTRKRTLPIAGVMSLSLQIIRALRFLHESQTSAGWTLSPDAIALTLPISTDWSVRHSAKFIELGGTISWAECSTDVERVFPSDYIGYLAPEMLDEDRSLLHGRDDVFRRMCQSDMYSLGVLLWEVATGRRPFDGARPAQVVASVLGRGERPGYPPSGLPVELQTLITRLWANDPESRPGAREACAMLEMVPSAPPVF